MEWAAPRVRDFMTQEVLDVEPSEALAAVLAQLSACRVSCVVVCEKGAPVGIITERDVAQVAANVVSGKGEPRETAGELMTSPVTTVRASEPMEQAISLVQEESIRHLPVVDANGRLVGLLTQTDLLRAQGALRPVLPGSARPTIYLRDIMQTHVLMLTPEMKLAEVEELFSEHHISGSPVLNRTGEVVGMLSESDLVACRTAGSQFRTDLAVSDLMTSHVLGAGVSEDVFRIAEEMHAGGVHWVVVYEEGRLAGIVTTLDILGALVHPGPK